MISESLLSKSKGVIHVGASTGEEAPAYAKHNLPVAWFEPIPTVFEQLRSKIAPYPNQIAYNYLIADKDGEEYPFNISNNEGASSSVFDLGLHAEAWAEVHYTEQYVLKGRTLDSLPLGSYDALVIDVQGAELLVLKGAVETLKHIQFAQIEAYDVEMYKGGATATDVKSFMESHGFKHTETEFVNEDGEPFRYYNDAYTPPLLVEYKPKAASGRVQETSYTWFELYFERK